MLRRCLFYTHSAITPLTNHVGIISMMIQVYRGGPKRTQDFLRTNYFARSHESACDDCKRIDEALCPLIKRCFSSRDSNAFSVGSKSRPKLPHQLAPAIAAELHPANELAARQRLNATLRDEVLAVAHDGTVHVGTM